MPAALKKSNAQKLKICTPWVGRSNAAVISEPPVASCWLQGVCSWLLLPSPLHFINGVTGYFLRWSQMFGWEAAHEARTCLWTGLWAGSWGDSWTGSWTGPCGPVSLHMTPVRGAVRGPVQGPVRDRSGDR